MKKARIITAFAILVLSFHMLDCARLWCQELQSDAAKKTTWLTGEEKNFGHGIHQTASTIISIGDGYVVLEGNKKIIIPDRVKVFDEAGKLIRLYQMKAPLEAKITYRLSNGNPTVISIRPLAK